jgi:NAD(P)-dependent dehydrogenase (short-subunit alcohol dehydrogenase family)
MSFDRLALTGRTALVIGGSTGIGLETVRLLAARGARVLATGRDTARLDQAAGAVPGVLTLRSDAGSPEDADTLRATVADRFGALDILVVNAGVTPFAPLGGWNAAGFDALMAINLRGPFLQLQALRPLMKHGGAVVLVSSIAARRGGEAVAAYGSSKAALSLLGRSLVEAFADAGVRLNTVSPGPIDTPAWDKSTPPQETAFQAEAA